MAPSPLCVSGWPHRRIRGALGLVALVVFAVLVAGVTIGDPWVRLANTHADDGPVLSTLLLLEPSRFAGDIVTSYATVNARASLVNWLPALLRASTGLAPEYAAIAIAGLQLVLNPLAMLRLARAVGVRGIAAFVSATMMMAFDPLTWNLANYGNLLAVPYAGTVVIGPILMAFASASTNRSRAAIGWLMLAALIHPSIGIYATLVLAAVSMAEPTEGGMLDRRRVVRLPALLLPLALAALPAVALRAQEARLPSDTLFEAMRRNIHMHPWVVRPLWWQQTLPLIAVTLFAASAAARRLVPPRARRLWAASVAVAVLFAVIHVAAWYTGVTGLLQLIPLRASLCVALVSVPLLAVVLIDAIASPHVVTRLSGLFAPLILGVFNSGLALGFVPGLAIPRPRRLSVAILAVLAIAVLTMPPALLDQVSAPGTVGRHLAVGAAAATAVAFLLSLRRFAERRRMRLAAAVLLAVLAPVALLKARSRGRDARTPLALGNLEAQRWARDHTPENAIFIVRDVPWRTVSHRRVVEPRASFLYVYSGSRRAAAFDDGYLRFYNLGTAARDLDTDELERRQAAAFRMLDADGFARLAAKFGGDYVVRLRSEPLSLPVAHENSAIVIYALPRPRVRVGRGA